ncbi:hypothetical protein GF407_18115 [candidate division KSB1 bacterium]|nr:hypothetical protein [candidate division KSB1 bacterium]
MRFLVVSVLLMFTQLNAQVVLSEIMFNPTGVERYNEFVELNNSSPHDSIDLNGWLISDGEKFNTILPYEKNCLLKPLQYALLLSPNYFTNSTCYDSLIPENTLLLTIEPSTFGSYGLSNSRGEEISLFRPDTTLVEKYQYTIPNPNGHSEEKRILNLGNNPANWANSTSLNGTPGFQNSITPPDFEFKLSDIKTEPDRPNRKDSIFVFITLRNTGIVTLNTFSIHLGKDTDQDSILDQDEIIITEQKVTDLYQGDSLSLEIVLPPQHIGLHHYTVQIQSGNDSLFLIHQDHVSIFVDYSKHDLIISEIYYDGTGNNFIELCNTTENNISLHNFQLCFEKSKKKIEFSDTLVLKSRDYLLLVEDKNKWNRRIYLQESKSLFEDITPENNAIMLCPEWGTTIDSVCFTVEKDICSYERSENFELTRCRHPQRKTPAGMNSTCENINDLYAELTHLSQDSLFIVDVRDFNLEFCVNRFGRNTKTDYTLSLYNNDQIVSVWHHSGTMTMKKHFHHFHNLTVGEHNCRLSLESSQDTHIWNNDIKFTFFVPCPYNTIVINEIMYNTTNKIEEWIELFNTSDMDIDLKDWQLADGKKSIVLSESSKIIQPFQYLLVVNQPPKNPDQTVEIIVNDNLPELNNSGDEVKLGDPVMTVVDSIDYSHFGTSEKNVSLERIRYEENSIDPANWQFSIDSTGSTPGRLNSHSPRKYDVGIQDVNFCITGGSLPHNKDCEICLVVENSGRNRLENISIKISAAPVNDSLHQSLIAEQTIASLSPKEQKQISVIWHTPPPGVHCLIAQLTQNMDMNPLNNCKRIDVTVGYPVGSAVINEIMASPAPDQPEWFEIYNPGEDPIELLHWSFCDSDTSSRYPLVDQSTLLHAKNFALISDELFTPVDEIETISLQTVTFPALNTSDCIYLMDGIGTIIDKIDYGALGIDIRGKSIERINPKVGSRNNNWSICVDPRGHTAGSTNSLFVEIPTKKTKLSVCPNPFSPNGDGTEDLVAITCMLPVHTAMINIRIFDCNGRMVRFLSNNQPAAAETTLFWNGRDDSGRPCRTGIYIVAVEAFERDSRRLEKIIKTVVLASY